MSEIDKLLASLREGKVEKTVEVKNNNLFTVELTSEFLFENIKDYSDVCKYLNESLEVCAYKQIKQIEKLFNGNWVKDWKNRDQYKYYPYYEINTSGGLVFLSSGYDDRYSDGQVGFYKNQETSNFIGRTFIKIYEKLI